MYLVGFVGFPVTVFDIEISNLYQKFIPKRVRTGKIHLVIEGKNPKENHTCLSKIAMDC